MYFMWTHHPRKVIYSTIAKWTAMHHTLDILSSSTRTFSQKVLITRTVCMEYSEGGFSVFSSGPCIRVLHARSLSTWLKIAIHALVHPNRMNIYPSADILPACKWTQIALYLIYALVWKSLPHAKDINRRKNSTPTTRQCEERINYYVSTDTDCKPFA